MNPPTHDTNGACSITCGSSATRIRYADAKPRVELEHTTKRENVPVSLSPVEQPSISACVVQSPWPVKSSISRFPGADTSSTNQVKNCGTWKAHFKEPHNKSAPEPHSRARKSSIGGLVGSPHPRKCGTIEPEKTCRRHRLSPAVIPHLHGQVGDDDENGDEDNDDNEGDDDDDDTDDLHGIHRGGFPQVSEGKGGSAVRWAGGAPEGRLRGTPLALPFSLPVGRRGVGRGG